MGTERNTYVAVNVTKDMTEGSPAEPVLGFPIPMLYGLLFQQLYNMANTIIVGKCLGVKALAAVGSTGSVNFMIIGSCLGVCSGFAIPVAQKLGERNEKALRRFVTDSVWSTTPFLAVTTVIVCPLCRNTLELMQTPEDIIDGVYSYIFVVLLGIPVIYLYNLLSCTIRSLGDSTTPLTLLVLSPVVDVTLDFSTILVLKMGVSGAVWITTTAQVVSRILCLLYMKKKLAILKMNDDEWRPDAHYMEILCNMGTPMSPQYSITATGSVILQTAVNSLGSMAVAAVTVGNKVSMFFCCPFDALGSIMATFGGQNVGARRLDRTDQGLRVGAVMGRTYAVTAFAVLCTFEQWIVLMLVDKGGGEVLRNTRLFFISNSLSCIPFVFIDAVRFMIQGLGYSRLATIAGVYEMVVCSFVGFCLVPTSGYIVVCIASPVAWITADLFLIPAYRYMMKNLNHLLYGRSRATATDATE